MNKKGQTFIIKVDTDVLLKLIKLDKPWGASYRKDCDSYYCVRTCYYEVDGKKKHKVEYLHRFIFDNPDSETVVDHINHDTLDNRRKNLRVTIKKKNLKNRNGKNINNKSGYRNVCRQDNQWVVQIQVGGKNTAVGRFPLDKLDEAGQFAEKMRQKYYGEFAGKN